MQEAWTQEDAERTVVEVVTALGPSLLFTPSLKTVRVLLWANGESAPSLLTQVGSDDSFLDVKDSRGLSCWVNRKHGSESLYGMTIHYIRV